MLIETGRASQGHVVASGVDRDRAPDLKTSIGIDMSEGPKTIASAILTAVGAGAVDAIPGTRKRRITSAAQKPAAKRAEALVMAGPSYAMLKTKRHLRAPASRKQWRSMLPLVLA